MNVDDSLSFADRMYTKSSFAGVLAAEVRRLREENKRLRNMLGSLTPFQDVIDKGEGGCLMDCSARMED